MGGVGGVSQPMRGHVMVAGGGGIEPQQGHGDGGCRMPGDGAAAALGARLLGGGSVPAAPAGGRHGRKRGKRGKGGGKPGWGNGGSGPPGQLKKQRRAAVAGEERTQQPAVQVRTSAAAAMQPARPDSRVADAHGDGAREEAAAAPAAGSSGARLRSAVQLAGVGGTYAPLEVEPARHRAADDPALRHAVQLHGVNGMQSIFSLQPTAAEPRDDTLRSNVQLRAVGDDTVAYRVQPG